MAIVLVNAARMVPNNNEKWWISWAGIEGSDLEGKSALIAMLIYASINRRGQRRNLVIKWAGPCQGSALFNLVRCMVGNGVGRMMLGDYRGVLSEGRTFVGVVGQFNFP